MHGAEDNTQGYIVGAAGGLAESREGNSSLGVCRNLCDGLSVWMKALAFVGNGQGFWDCRSGGLTMGQEAAVLLLCMNL